MLITGSVFPRITAGAIIIFWHKKGVIIRGKAIILNIAHCFVLFSH